MKFVAFLRGINVGGNKQIKMADLVKCFEKLGLKDVKTYIASGNVIFESSESANKLKPTLEVSIKKTFGFESLIFIRSMDDLKLMVKSDPFKGVKISDKIRTDVAFLERVSKSKTLSFSTKNMDAKVTIKKDNAFVIRTKKTNQFEFPKILRHASLNKYSLFCR